MSAKLFSAVRFLTLSIGGTVLVLMALQIAVDVALRSVLGTGVPATSELTSKYWMVLVSFLPLAMAEVERRHIEASVFMDMMPRVVQLASVYLGVLLSLVVYVILTYLSALEALDRTERGAYVEVGTHNLIIWPSYWFLPISFALMALVLIFRTFPGPRAVLAASQSDGANT